LGVSVIKGFLGTLNTNLAYLKENAKKKLNNLEYNLKERIKNPRIFIYTTALLCPVFSSF